MQPPASVLQLLAELRQLYDRRSATLLADGTPEPTLVHIEQLAASEAVFGELERPLPLLLETALQKRGINRLYSHQVQAIEALRGGSNVALVTATASGKTLSFNLPILETILAHPRATALYIFPTNALMNDQLATLNALLADIDRPIRAFKYNGTMSDEQKREARRARPNILLTNPELIHLSLTAWHKAWPDFLRNLRYIVIDEVHIYRGVFGSHIAHLIRRLRRVCEHYGAKPQFMCCSATIGNPIELVQKLTGLADFVAVTNDGSRKNKRYFTIWKPPTFPPDEHRPESLARSYLEETVDLFKHLIRSGYATLCFSRLRRYAENMYRMCRDSSTANQMQNVMVYRAGLKADERVAIERGLKEGRLDGVFSTNALELGIDIGGLDAVIIAGYPGSQMAVWQQAGRAGRGDKEAAVFLVASQNPIDQYFLANPSDLFLRRPESALLSVENESIARQHLACMAAELPFNRAELERYYPASISSLVKQMIWANDLGLNDLGICFYPHDDNPHGRLSLRTSTTRKYTIVDEVSGREIGLIEPPNLYIEAHPDAIYTHAGDTYRVQTIDEAARKVLVKPVNTNHMTSSVARTQVRLEGQFEQRTLTTASKLPMVIGKGRGLVTAQIYGYREQTLFQRGRQAPDVINLKQPLMVETHTELLWLILPTREEFADIVALDSGLHGLEHLLVGLFPLEVMCDPMDIGSTSYGAHIPNDNRPTIYFFDSCEGGAGFAHGCYERIEELLQVAYQTVKSCRCVAGCPACVQSARCREMSDRISKVGARLLLQRLLT